MANQKDITGQRFGLLEVVSMVKKGHLYHAVCKCACGKVKTCFPCNLRKGVGNCGCIPRARKPPLTDLVGRKFGFLLVTSMEQIGKTPSGEKSGTYYAICECLNCGKSNYPVVPTSLRRGATTSCGCHRNYSCNTGENNAGFKGHKEIRSNFWRGYQRGAQDRGIEFSLTMPYVWDLFEKQGRKCALSGVPLVFGVANNNSLTTASIDRIDSSKGYVVGNVQWVHKKINIMKHTSSTKDFIEWCNKVVSHNKKNR